MITRGILIDQLLPNGQGVKRTEPHLKALRAALSSPDGQTILNILNQIVVGYTPPISHVTKSENYGALIALETSRNFVRELEAIASYNGPSSTSAGPDKFGS